jgi:hypothetical protein
MPVLGERLGDLGPEAAQADDGDLHGMSPSGAAAAPATQPTSTDSSAYSKRPRAFRRLRA